MSYYLILALQGYCIYHLLKHRKQYYWIFLIVFIPVIGSIIYIITQVYNRQDVKKVTSEITTVVNPTKRIKDLEKQLEFSESYQNRVNLADAYLENKDYDSAIPLYLESIEGNPTNDLYVKKQLIEAYFNIEDYNNVVVYAKKIEKHPEFNKSRSQFIYGLALEKIGDFEQAEANLRAIDIRYSFYNERLILAKFLIDRNKEAEAKGILEEIISESLHMTKPNRALFNNTIQEVEKLLKSLNK